MYETLHFKTSYQYYRKSGACNILHKNSSDLYLMVKGVH